MVMVVDHIAALDTSGCVFDSRYHPSYHCCHRPMKAKPNYTRAAKKVTGAEKAASPRSHAEEPAGGEAKKQNPQRLDIIRRHMLSSRNNDNA